jgi:pimeloyl-ACP methyl ester carboxylesterase
MNRKSHSAAMTAFRLRCFRLFLCVCGVLFLGGCALERGYEAALVVADIGARDQPSRLKKVTPAPERGTVSFAVEGRPYRGDLYRSEEGSLAGLLLIPGAAEEGKDDPRLVALATTLARARFAVLVPDLASLRQLRVNPGNIREVTDTFAWLVSRPDLTPEGRAGMVAFSYAAGPAVLAALEPEIRDRVRFILAVGGYYDLVQALTFFTTGYFRKDDEWRHLQPNEYGKWVFVLSNVGLLADSEDRQLLKAMAQRKMDDLAAPLDDLAERLGPEGRTVFAFITNRDPPRVRQLVSALPAGIREDIEALNPALRDLSLLKARLILIHGYDDDIIPYTQSVALARAVPKGQARLFLVRGLFHVDIRPGLLSRWRLWRAIGALLAERKRIQPPVPE